MNDWKANLTSKGYPGGVTLGGTLLSAGTVSMNFTTVDAGANSGRHITVEIKPDELDVVLRLVEQGIAAREADAAANS